MNIKIDEEANAAYIQFNENKVHRTVVHNEEFLVDVDEKGEVIGIEVLNYSSQKLTPQKLQEVVAAMQTPGRNRS
ncbi:MAG TPA: DUF2283 domain-containing protein [Candidatus Paceibacterota bacterium]|jgi:uncharacterized protein YuzE|nr:DUF2283 domain-containing protein [Candidatus Paceibacterota bacterium]